MELDFPSNHNSHITSSKTPSVKFDPPAISQDINMGINQNYEEDESSSCDSAIRGKNLVQLDIS